MIEQVISRDDRNTKLGVTREFVTMPSVLLFVAWVLILFTFSMPDRFNGHVSLDVIAKLKVATRAISFAVLAVMLLWQWTSVKGASVIHCLLPLGLFAVWGFISVVWSPLKMVSIGQIVSFSVLLLLAANVALYWSTQACTSRVFLHLSLVLLAFSTALTLARIFLPDIGSGIRSDDSLVLATMAGANASLGII